jgi:hypothetical protein
VKVTGAVTAKLYKCVHCAEESVQTTNHYGETYSRCKNFQCVSRLPNENARYTPPRHECLSPLPEGWGRPEPWKQMKLGDICELIMGEDPK